MTTDSDYWFLAKRFGWGWGPPVAWQGWAVLVSWIIALAVGTLLLLPQHLAVLGLFVLGMSVLLIAVCYVKGEPPAWRWGDREK